MGFSHSPITLTVSKRRPPSTLGGSENNITFVSVKILYSKSNQIFVFAEKKKKNLYLKGAGCALPVGVQA